MMDNDASVTTRSGAIAIRQVTTIDECRVLDRLLTTVWGVTPPATVVDPETLRALSYSGNYVAAAYRGETMVGGTVSFVAPDRHLHSHVTGVLPQEQGSGVGLALKLEQRDWALRNRITSIQWTFDPMRIRNAYFNIQRLGGLATAYLPDFYGDMADELNAGTGPSDRLLVDWRIDTPRVRTALSHGLEPPRGRGIPVHDIQRLRDELQPALHNGEVIAGVDVGGGYFLEGQSYED